ncbi:MAG: hypothetical protein GW802_36805, partial [Armatimonadetes bacterium]|nr:hypothetical protein [Armatimonadota bacterium]
MEALDRRIDARPQEVLLRQDDQHIWTASGGDLQLLSTSRRQDAAPGKQTQRTVQRIPLALATLRLQKRSDRIPGLAKRINPTGGHVQQRTEQPGPLLSRKAQVFTFAASSRLAFCVWGRILSLRFSGGSKIWEAAPNPLLRQHHRP